MSFQQPSPESLSSKGRVCTLGMFILDHFEVSGEGDQAVPSDSPSIGGGGIYAMTSARLFLPPSHCGMIIDEGYDFPTGFKKQLSSMGEEMIWWRPRDGKTTRALNLYSSSTMGEGHQSFQYISPQLQLSLQDLILPPSPFATPLPEWVHVVVRIPRAREITLEAKRIEQEGINGFGQGWKPKMIWEPLGVQPGNAAVDLEAWLDIAASFAAISPNLLELQTILQHDPLKTGTAAAERAAEEFCSMLDRDASMPVLVLRAGTLGCYIIAADWRGWTPAYWTSNEQARVIDPTGGGNAFLGGLCAGLLLTDDWKQGELSAAPLTSATLYGAVAASFAIQQRGLPSMTEEGWNSDNPWTRLQTLAARVGDTCHE